MTITAKWLLDNKVFLVTYQGIIEIDDLKQLTNDMVSMIDQSDSHLVHSLIDVRQIERYPMNVVQIISSTRKLLTHPRYGWMIVFGNPDSAMGFILHTIAGAMRLRMRMFTTLVEAKDFLQSVDSSISLPTTNTTNAERSADA